MLQQRKHEGILLNLEAVGRADVVTDPFPYLSASGVVPPDDLQNIANTFPPIDQPGIFPLSELTYGTAFARLIDDLTGPELTRLLEQKFDMQLFDKPLMITVRGLCQAKDGRIHTDSKDKLLTCLLYLNDRAWSGDGGRLRLLRDGRDLNSAIAEVAPDFGNFVAFKRTDNSWHGHARFVGPRRYVMVNWLRSDMALAKNVGRHRLSAAFKRWGLARGY
jgi:hypothetical protein